MSLVVAATLILFPVLMAYAAWSDLFTMTISNRVSIILVIGFVTLAMLTGMSWATLFETHLASGFAVLILTFILFAMGWIGGGDAKLAAATAVWLGWSNLMDFGLETSVIGGALTLLILSLRKTALPGVLMKQAWIARLHQQGNGVPYGIALAVAGLITYPDTVLWRAAIGA